MILSIRKNYYWFSDAYHAFSNENDKIIGIGECKFYVIHKVNSNEFYQTKLGKHNAKLNSGYDYCIQHGFKKYVLIIRIVPWMNEDLCIHVNVDDPNKILVFKDDLRKYINNFKNFDASRPFIENEAKKEDIK